VLLAGGFFDGGVAAADRFEGGWHWQAAAGALVEGVLATCVSLWAVGHFRAHQERYFRPLIRRMAPPAYGAFIIHPPVLVGLAFALQPIPAPAELKFLALLVAGVAGSFSVTAVVQSVAPFRHTRPTLRPASSRRSARPREIRMRDTEARREASRPIRSP
jgi:peptidoglycan/LPS O-acetylase OafA/YrhL